ncbi:MAG TPA: AAA family ATPase [Acidobacteriaceae bacterium]|nr:AAA family ATPase [Acidobacteriaceae bacterium]
MIQLRTLGVAEIALEKASIGPDSVKMFALLIHLCIEKGKRVSRESLQDMLYPELSKADARHNLRQLLHRARRFGVPVSGGKYTALISGDAVCADYDALLSNPTISLDLLESASGGFLPVYAPTISDSFTEWLDRRRADIEARLTRTLATRLAHAEDRADWEVASLIARALLAIDPLHEGAIVAQARVLALTGSKSVSMDLLDKYLGEIGVSQADGRHPVAVLRRRIAERLTDNPYRVAPNARFVGRGEHLRLLNSLTAGARTGTPQALVLWGEPGIGKTRLLAEMSRMAVLSGVSVQSVVCQPHQLLRPMGAFIELVAGILDQPGALACTPSSHRLIRLFTESDGNQERMLVDPSSPASTFAAFVSAIADLLAAVTSQVPLMITIDDAQWLDPTSFKALSALVANSSLRKLVIVLASRERLLTPSDATPSYQLRAVRLGALEREASVLLLRAVLTEYHIPPSSDVEDRILQLSDGNPYFIQLLASAYSTTRDLSAIPSSVAEAITHRLDQISVSATKTLEACVVLGKNATPVRVSSVVGLSQFDLLVALQEVESRGLMSVDEMGAIRIHSLLTEAIARRMASSVRSLLNRHAALLLESENVSSSPMSQLWDCAEHWRLAGDECRSAAILRRYARHLSSIGRPVEAVEMLQRTRSFSLPDEHRLAVTEQILRAAELGTIWGQMADLLLERKALLSRLGRPLPKHDAFEHLEVDFLIHSQSPQASRAASILRGCVMGDTASPEHRLVASRKLLILAELTLDSALATFSFESVADLCDQPDWASHTGLIYHSCFGDPELAVAIARAILHSIRPSDPTWYRDATNAGYALFRAGEVKESEQLLEQIFRDAQSQRRLGALANSAILCATARRILGDTAGARHWLGAAGNAISTLGASFYSGRYHLALFNVALDENCLSEAAEHLKYARNLPQAKELASPRLQVFAAELRLRYRSGSLLCSDEELSELLAGHLRARSIGTHDDVAAIVYESLCLRGRKLEGDGLLRAYIQQHRRERHPVIPHLARLLSGNAICEPK